MSLLVFSDLHAHAFRSHSYITEEGLNSRLHYSLSALEQVLNWARRHQSVEAVIFAGDLFDSRGVIRVPTFNRVFDILEQFSTSGIPLLMLPGNHDYATVAEDTHVLEALRKVGTVFDQPCVEEFVGKFTYRILFLPYTKDLYSIRKRLLNFGQEKRIPQVFRIVVGHIPIEGATIGTHEFMPSSPLKLKDLEVAKADAIALGHFHKRQFLGSDNMFYVGSLLQINFSEMGQPKGFAILSPKRNGKAIKIHFEEIDAPSFCVVADEDWESEQIQGNYVKLLTGPNVRVDEKKRELLNTGALSVIVDSETDEKQDDSRLPVSLDMGIKDLEIEYVEKHCPDGLDPEQLLQIAEEIRSETDTL